MDITENISSNKASGYDGISIRVLKKIAPVFVNPLCKLLNLSITTNSFPNHWKVAKVTPLHKVEHEMTQTITAQYQFYLSSHRFSKST